MEYSFKIKISLKATAVIDAKEQCKILKSNFEPLHRLLRSGQEKTQFPLPGARKCCSWASENRSLLAQWASEISLSSLMSPSERVSLINDNFQSETSSKLKTAR